MRHALLFLLLGGILLSCKAEPEVTSSTPAKFQTAEFSGQKALDHIKELEKFGPRPPESKGYAKSLIYLEDTLHEMGWSTKRQKFRSNTPLGPVKFTNLLARFGKEQDWNNSVPFIIGSHLDTKRYTQIRFMGSNDSGSSTGLLVELARVLTKSENAAKQVELVFFDGEEAFVNFSNTDGLYGSRYNATELRSRSTQPKTGFVLDLVGDLKVPLLIGIDSPKDLRDIAAKAVTELKLGEAVKEAKEPILDDHMPLIHIAHLPTLHLIGDFKKMSYWHTKDDTLKNVSSQALENSGKLTLKVLEMLSP